jgi:serine/threonine protein kinase
MAIAWPGDMAIAWPGTDAMHVLKKDFPEGRDCLFKVVDSHHCDQGANSAVYRARYRSTGQMVALKCMTWAVMPESVVAEIRMLRRFDYGHPNLVRLLTGWRKQSAITLVFPFIRHENFSEEIVCRAERRVVKAVMHDLLSALFELHEQGIVHRAVKPSNFPFSVRKMRGCLIDFGLAIVDLTVPGARPDTDWRVMSGAGTRGFRAPETLMDADIPARPIDIWAAGVMLFMMLTRRKSAFPGDSALGLWEIAQVLGTDAVRECATEVRRIIYFPAEAPARDLGDVVRFVNPAFDEQGVGDDAIDLLSKMLRARPSDRLTAGELLRHPFFGPEK